VAEYGTDDTAAVQAAINAAVSGGGGGTVYFPAGKIFLVSRLNMTNMSGVHLEGAGPLASRIMPLSVASYGTSNGHLIDMTGSLYVSISDLQIGAGSALAVPTTGIFLAQTSLGQSNRIDLRNLYVSGKFTTDALYIYGVPSSHAIGLDLYNYVNGVGHHGPMQMTSTNSLGLTSSFATVATGTWNTSDFHFFDCEWHKFAGAAADSSVIILDGVSNVGFFGGVVSGGATAYIFYYNTNAHLTFANVTFETESEPVVPLYGHYKQTGSTTDLSDTQSSYILTGGGAKFNGSPVNTNQVSTAF
jgi:hypothetical protein